MPMVGKTAWLGLMLMLYATFDTANADVCHAASVSAGDSSTCAVLTDGTAKCWGDNSHEQLGPSNTSTALGPISTPVSVRVSHSVLQVAVHAGFACAVLDDHSVSCWGGGIDGQLGFNDVQDHLPTHLQLGVGNAPVQRLSTGCSSHHSCAAVEGQGIMCWGSASGLAGTPWTNHGGGGVPSRVNLGSGISGLPTVLDMCTGNVHTCVLTKQWGLQCWGVTTDGQLGLGHVADTRGLAGTQLVIDLGSSSSAVSISCGAFHTCAVLNGGTLKCWGSNDHGQLGYGNIRTRGTFDADMGDNLQPISVGSGRTVKQVSAGGSHTCALLDNGEVKCWGDNSLGQLGVSCGISTWGDKANQMGDNLPAVNLGPSRTAISVSAGFNGACAVLDDGSVTCWGDNTSGQLGLNTASGHFCVPQQAVDLGTDSNPTSVLLNGGAGDSSAKSLVSKQHHSVSGGAIGGAVIGSLLAVALVGSAIWWWRVKRGMGGNPFAGANPKQWFGNLLHRSRGDSNSGFGAPAAAEGSMSQQWGMKWLQTRGESNSGFARPNTTVWTSAKERVTHWWRVRRGHSNSGITGPDAAEGAVPKEWVVSWLQQQRERSNTGFAEPSAPENVGARGKATQWWASAKEGCARGWVKTREWCVWAWANTKEWSIRAWANTREWCARSWASTQEGCILGWANTKAWCVPRCHTLGERSSSCFASTKAAAAGACAKPPPPQVVVVASAEVAADGFSARSPVHTTVEVKEHGGCFTWPARSTTTSMVSPKGTSSSHNAPSVAAPSSGLVGEGSVGDMRIPWSHLIIGKVLGEGGFSTVYKAKWQAETVAVKLLNVRKTSSATIGNLYREALIMSQLRHPCIARVYGVVDEEPHHALVMQYYPKGTLAKLMMRAGYAQLELPIKVHIARQIASGMRFMHERPVPVLHGDLKASNILLSAPGRQVAIADFGLSQAMLVGQEASVASGALTYSISPPEVLKDPLAPRTRAADVYAFAIVLLELITGQPAYQGLRNSEIRRFVTAGHRPPVPSNVPPALTAIIESCWAEDPAARPAFAVIVQQLTTAHEDLQATNGDGTTTDCGTMTMTDW